MRCIMKITLDIPCYDGNALDVVWETGSKYAINVEKGLYYN